VPDAGGAEAGAGRQGDPDVGGGASGEGGDVVAAVAVEVATARAAEFVGWLYRDAGLLPAASYWQDRAEQWAQEAGDLPLQGYILLKKSQLV